MLSSVFGVTPDVVRPMTFVTEHCKKVRTRCDECLEQHHCRTAGILIYSLLLRNLTTVTLAYDLLNLKRLHLSGSQITKFAVSWRVDCLLCPLRKVVICLLYHPRFFSSLGGQPRLLCGFPFLSLRWFGFRTSSRKIKTLKTGSHDVSKPSQENSKSELEPTRDRRAQQRLMPSL